MNEPIADLSDALRHWASVYGDRPAVIGERDALSFTALEREADRRAAAWNAAGYGAGSHVGLLAGNGPEWLAAAFGVWRAGATLVPISTFVTARELGEILDHADVEALIVQPRLRSHDYLEVLRGLPPLPRLQTVVTLGDDPRASPRGGAERGAVRDASPIVPEPTACILYTSGTTGRPKGVMLSHRAILATMLPTAARTGLDPSDSLLSSLPLFWVAGLVIRALPTLATGCALILLEAFTIEGLIEMLRRHRPTALHLRPPQVGQLLAHPDFSPELLERVRKGGGRVDWFGKALGSEARFITGYGMTEMSGYVTALDWQDSDEARRSQLGAPLPAVEIRIVDPEGHPCPTGQVGEIRTRGPGLFSGYYKQASGTGLDRDGFFVTGDLGRFDDSGTLHFIGRSKDLLRVKGINVSPLEVEAVFGGHPSVDGAYVVGLPPDGLEQELVALIVPKETDDPTLETELRALAREALSHYKRPQQYVFIDRSEVPLGGTSKPQRGALADLAARRLAER